MKLIAANELELIYAVVVAVDFCIFLLTSSSTITRYECPKSLNWSLSKWEKSGDNKVLNANQYRKKYLYQDYKNNSSTKLTTK